MRTMPQRFPAKIAVTALNEPGSLAQVAAVIGEADGNIDNIKMMKPVPDYAEMVHRPRSVGPDASERNPRRVAGQGRRLQRHAGRRLIGKEALRVACLNPGEGEISP